MITVLLYAAGILALWLAAGLLVGIAVGSWLRRAR